MPTITLQEARATLPEILHRLMPGEEIRIIENGRIVGRLLPGESWPPAQPFRQADSMPGSDVEIASHSGKESIDLSTDDKEQEKCVGQWPCRAGSAKGKIRIAADFNDPLDAFSEYM